jgi:hypothetical protein
MMKTIMSLLLLLGLMLAPGLRADDAAAASPAAPDLPADKAEAKDLPADVSATASQDSQVETPKEIPDGQRKAESLKLVPDKPQPRRWGNFVLGALGGGVLAGGAAFLLEPAKPDGSIDYKKAEVVVPLAAVGGMIIGGTLSVLLGLTTPLPAAPPAMNSQIQGQGPSLAWAVLPEGGSELVFRSRF